MTEISWRPEAERAHSAFLSIGASPALWFSTSAIIALAIILGGGTRQGLWSDAVVQLASLVLLGGLAFRGLRQPQFPDDRFALVLVAALLLLPLIQLVSLPPTLWSALPGRPAIVAVFEQAAMALPWLPISLDPAATSRAWLALLPAVAVFLATLHLGLRARRSLSLLIIALGLVSVLLGLAQLMQGPTSPLRFYPVTNPGDSVGFFANRNHYATLLTALIPITAAWMIGLIYDHRANRTLTIAVCLVGYAAWIIGLGMARSRAGIALAILAAIASLLLAVAAQPHGRRRGVLVIGAATMIGGLLVVHFAFYRLIDRFDADILADLRFTIAGITGEAIWAYFPVGSGFGTFESIYRILEPRGALLQSYVNHAHNDWLEALLEGGALAGILILAFLIWFIVRGHRLWREPSGSDETLDRALAQAATITIALLLLHSLVEYPLRTTAISVLFAWSAALLIKPIQRGDANERRVRGPNHTGNKTHRHRLPRRGQNAWTPPRSGLRRSIN